MIEFFKVVENGLDPCRASKSANGTVPTNGFRYCEPVRIASSFGWYVFLPLAFRLLWKGDEILCSLDDGEVWFPLTDAIQYPHFSGVFDKSACEEAVGYSPPFLSRTNDRDVVQIWTGMFARTRSNCSVLVRGPANLVREDIEVLEGVVHTDWWFGPLFANVRIHRKDDQIIFRVDQPFLQLQPVDRQMLKELDESPAEIVKGLEALGPEEWAAYSDTVVRRMQTRTKMGQYAVEARKHS